MRKYRITYAILLLSLGILAGVMRDRYFVSMFLSALILPLLSLLWLFLSVRGTVVTAHTIQQTPKKGYPVSMVTTLRHPRWMFLPTVSLHLFPGSKDDAADGEDADDAVVLLSSELSSTLPSGSSRMGTDGEGEPPTGIFPWSNVPLFLTSTMLFDCCGEYSLQKQQLKVMDLLHLFCLRKPITPQVGVTQSLLIYPNIYPLRGDSVFAMEQDAERLYRAPSGIPDESNIIGYKVHQDYDDSRYIHWKLSARGEEFLAKQFYSATQSNVLLVLDFAPLSSVPQDYNTRITLDCMLETTVSLVSDYLQHGQQLALLYFQDTLQYEPLSSMAQFDAFYQKSPYLGSNATFSLTQLLTLHGNAQSAQEENNTALILTPCVDIALVTQIERLMALRWTVLVVDCAYFPSDVPLQGHLATCPNLYYSTAEQLYADTAFSAIAEDASFFE